MDANVTEQPSNDQVIEAAARGELSEAQVERLFERAPGLGKLALIAAVQAVDQQRRINDQQRSEIDRLQGRPGGAAADPAPPDPATPSGQQPLYAKPNRRKRRRRNKRGARPGHKGRRPSGSTAVNSTRR